MNLYCVFQEGVYRHECAGVFDSWAEAVKAADAIAFADHDSYHNYDVFQFTLNEIGKEGSALYSVNKDKATQKRDER